MYTQIQHLDNLLESFKQESVYVPSIDEFMPVEHWRNCDANTGYCHGVSEVLVEFLAEHGIKARVSDSSCEDDIWDSPDWLGYDDRPIDGMPFHVLCLVECEDQIFSVDYTAAQYGYEQFPLVQRLHGDFRKAGSSWDWERLTT